MEGSHNIRTPVTEFVDQTGPLLVSSSSTQFCDIAPHLPDAILEFNAEEKCNFANPPAGHLFGMRAERMRGMNMTELGLPDELVSASHTMLRRARESGEPQSLETICEYNGQQRHFEARFIPPRNPQGSPSSVIMMVRDITEFRCAEQAAKMNALRVKQVSRQVLRVQEQSSRHLARELHDEVGQTLTAVKFALQNLAQADNDSQQQVVMAHSIEMVSGLLERIRSISLDLRPSLLDDLGLEAALRSFARRQAALGHFDVDISFALPESRIDPDIETTCYRIFQEGLTNVLKYASANTVWIRLSTDENLFMATLPMTVKGLMSTQRLIARSAAKVLAC